MKESETLLQSAHKKNVRWKKWGILGSILILLFFGWKFFSGNGEEETSDYEIITAETGDISISIDADGFIESEQTYSLFFEQSGTVEKILITEGDTVQQGDVLATLKNTELGFELEKSRIALETAKANLNQVLAGATPEELTIAQKQILSAQLDSESSKEKNDQSVQTAELELAEAKRSLELAQLKASSDSVSDTLDISRANTTLGTAQENLRIAQENQEKNIQDFELRISQNYESAETTLNASNTVIDAAMKEATLILQPDNEEGYDLGYLFSAQNDQQRRNLFLQYDILKSSINTNSLSVDFSTENLELSSAALQKQIDLLKTVQYFLSEISQGLDDTVTSSTVTVSQLSVIKNTVLQNETQISAQIQTLLQAQQNLETVIVQAGKQKLADENAIIQAENALTNAKNSQERLESNQETKDLQTTLSVETAQRNYERAQLDYDNAVETASITHSLSNTKIEIAQNQYSNLKNAPRAVDTAVLRQQIRNAEVNFQQAKYRYEQSILYAPFDGVILEDNLEVGQKISSSGSTPHMKIRSNKGFMLKTNVEEAEVARITEGQKVVVYFDALEDVFLDGEVSHISPQADKDSNGVVTYEVSVTITEKNPEGVREGMTAYGKFIIAESNDTLIIPLSAVQNDEQGSFVILENGERRNISTGLTNGKMVEVMSGVKEGEKIRVEN